jgi:PPOX class probable F420-dependent enzyme
MTACAWTSERMQLPPAVRALFETHAQLAYLTTLNRDGSPQVTAVVVGLDGEDIVSAHLFRNQKVRNVERDGRVALTIQTPGHDAGGRQHYLVIYGQARAQEGGAADLLTRLSGAPPPIADPPPGYVLRITPERLSGLGRPYSSEA